MRSIQALIAICLVFMCLVHVGLADTGGCAPSQIKVTVRPVFGDVTYDFSTGIPEIQAMAGDIVHQVRQGWALGFTRYRPMLDMDAPIAVTALPDGKFCAQPRYVTIDVGTRDETVYIPHEIPGESCGFSEVIEHEQKHLGSNREMAQKYAALIEKRFGDYFAANETLPASSADEAVLLQQNMMRAALGDAAGTMIADIRAAQQDIDSAGEYQRLLSSCHGELAEIVRYARQEWYVARRL